MVGRLARYEKVNNAERPRRDPVMAGMLPSKITTRSTYQPNRGVLWLIDQEPEADSRPLALFTTPKSGTVLSGCRSFGECRLVHGFGTSRSRPERLFDANRFTAVNTSKMADMIRMTFLATLLLMMSNGSLAGEPEPLCVLSPDEMPERWRPQTQAQKALSSSEPWSQKEAKRAQYAIRTGVNEIIGLLSKRPSAVRDVWDESVESLISVTYSSANEPGIDAAARDAARRHLTILIDSYMKRGAETAKCDEFERLLPLAMYAHRLYPEKDPRIGKMTELTNASFRDCGSFKNAVNFDYQESFSDKNLSIGLVFDLVLLSQYMSEAELYPEIELPDEAREFTPALWSYLETYPLAGASEFNQAVWNEEFIVNAYLATHIAYIPTGNHRYPLYIEDSPKLYRFHRENFYTVLEKGHLDLLGEFVDSLRQYGCTAENDLQVRDGTRYLLKVFDDGNDRWMAYREPDEREEHVSDYDLVHKAWTGMIGVRSRNIEPAEPGTYGGLVRRWLPHPR